MCLQTCPWGRCTPLETDMNPAQFTAQMNWPLPSCCLAHAMLQDLPAPFVCSAHGLLGSGLGLVYLISRQQVCKCPPGAAVQAEAPSPASSQEFVSFLTQGTLALPTSFLPSPLAQPTWHLGCQWVWAGREGVSHHFLRAVLVFCVPSLFSLNGTAEADLPCPVGLNVCLIRPNTSCGPRRGRSCPAWKGGLTSLHRCPMSCYLPV